MALMFATTAFMYSELAQRIGNKSDLLQRVDFRQARIFRGPVCYDFI